MPVGTSCVQAASLLSAPARLKLREAIAGWLVARIQAKGFFELRSGIVDMPLLHQGNSQIEMPHGEIGLETDDLLEFFPRFVGVALGCQMVSQLGVSLPKFGVQFDGPPIAGDGVGVCGAFWCRPGRRRNKPGGFSGRSLLPGQFPAMPGPFSTDSCRAEQAQATSGRTLAAYLRRFLNYPPLPRSCPVIRAPSRWRSKTSRCEGSISALPSIAQKRPTGHGFLPGMPHISAAE